MYYKIVWKGFWHADVVDVGWAIDGVIGSMSVWDRLANMSFDECILITDKKMKGSIKKRIEKLA